MKNSTNEQEVIMYGQKLWPRPPDQFYDYKELRSGIWLFRDLDRWLARNQSTSARGQMMRHIVGHFHAFASHELAGESRARIERLGGVVSTLSRLMERNPEGECKFLSPVFREKCW
jgi:hypothetical protein